VGSDTKGKRELPEGLLARARCLWTTPPRRAALASCNGRPKPPAPKSATVLSGKAAFARGAGDITVFDMTGIALQDLTVARMLEQRARLPARARAWPGPGDLFEAIDHILEIPLTATTQSHPLAALDTPAAVIDLARMQRNIERMQQRMNALGVRFRPHVKTSKCTPVARAQLAAGAQGITVSTLKEAAQFYADGFSDILYAVGMVPAKLPQALALRRQGCDLKIITDSVASAEAIAAFGREHGEKFEVWIEIDSDGHRSGIKPGEAALLEVARTLHEGGMRLGGVMTHAGSSYDLQHARGAGRHGRAGARRLRAGRRTRARRGLSLRGGQRGLHTDGAVGGAA
jgi:hypothetical protein